MFKASTFLYQPITLYNIYKNQLEFGLYSLKQLTYGNAEQLEGCKLATSYKHFAKPASHMVVFRRASDLLLDWSALEVPRLTLYNYTLKEIFLTEHTGKQNKITCGIINCDLYVWNSDTWKNRTKCATRNGSYHKHVYKHSG